jgi:flagellar biosynthetic protein FlhB
MADHRPFPPSPRRRILARQAGLHAASPFVVGAGAAGAALVATIATASAIAHRLGAAVAAACSQRAVLEPAGLAAAVAAIALPIAGAAAVAALIAQLAQTRAAWLPRRRIPGAPALDAGPGARTRRTAGELTAAAAIAGLTFAWLWWASPHLAALPSLDPAAAQASAPAAPLMRAAAALLANLGIALVVAWLAVGVLDALARHAGLARALRMTAGEKRDDDRLAGADPRWRARRAAHQRGPTASDAVAGASVVILGDDTAVAIAWDPVRRPVPLRTAAGRGPRATQLVGLARRHRIAVHRDPALAAALAAPDRRNGPVPEPHWPRLAEIIAAIRGRDRTA